jgi:hypothetical protein
MVIWPLKNPNTIRTFSAAALRPEAGVIIYTKRSGLHYLWVCGLFGNGGKKTKVG